MRTKTLLLTAVLAAAGIASSMAQVYSVNIVGYVNVSVPAGFSIIANPLNNSAGNDLNTLIPNAGVGDTIYKWNGSGFDAFTYLDPDPALRWSPNTTLVPGEGAFYSAGAAATVTFVGEVQLNSTNHLPAGFSLKSSVVPQSDKLDNLGFPADVGDNVYFFRNGGYQAATFLDPAIGFAPDAIPAVGEGFFVQKTVAAADWKRSFSVN